jgi:ABC-type sugar transport system ATPase subunit
MATMSDTRPAAPAPASAALLTMSGISKRYGPVRALDDVDFDLRAGEVMALLGENGAGKSTLVKILSGLISPDAGQIALDGVTVDLGTAARSRSAGIAVVQQELSLIRTLTAAENVFLGGADAGGVWTGRRLSARARPFLQRVGLGDLDPRRFVDTLSVAERQLVEIARLLARDSRILILDEPTAALADVEIERVKQVVRQLAGSGHSIIYVTHRLGEVFEIADRATVFRNGKSQPPVAVADLTIDTLVERMLGRPLDQMYPARASNLGQPTLDIRGLEAPGLVEPINLTVRAGEILGLAGQLGSGAPSVLRAVAGIQLIASGQILLEGEELPQHSLKKAVARGVAFCSEDRKRDGIFSVRTVTENLTAPSLGAVSPGGWISRSKERELAREIAGFFAIDRARLGFYARTLSGGNQQKVALGKWLGIRPKVLLVEEPTRGVDVGARAEIYTHLRRLADDGLAIVFASGDLPEVLGLADTVASFYRGRLVRVQAAEGLEYGDVLRDVTHGRSTTRPGEAEEAR